jgi:hypothetical protein
MPARVQMKAVLAALVFFTATITGFGVEPGRTQLSGHVPAVVSRLPAKNRLSATNTLSLAIGLPLRNVAALDRLLHELYDPASTNYHKFLTPPEFTAHFGPSEQEYAAVRNFAETNGFTVVGTHGNRLVLDVQARAAAVENAFHVTLRTYQHPAENRDFFAPDTEPSVPTNLPVADIWGLSDYGRPRPLSHPAKLSQAHPLSGSGPSGYYAGNDFRNAYASGTSLTGAGQAVGLLEFSDYYPVDITNYENTIGATIGTTNYVPLTNVVISSGRHGGGGGISTANNVEVALDIEMAVSMAPGLSRVIVYEISSSASSIVSRMATDNLAKQLSSSWTWSGGPSTTVDAAFKQMASQGQSFFQASGDSDAYTGSQLLGSSSQDAPVDSTNITAVGGTTLTMNGSGSSWLSETVWNYASYGIAADVNVGSGGGISTYYTIPYWQTNISFTASQGSNTDRNVPDVALTADGVYVAYNNGSSGGEAGTSCAAPLWAGFCALANQLALATNGTTLGFLNPALYNIAGSSCYLNCFHDLTAGNNIGTNTTGLFNAVAGYDLCTGLGTPNGTNLINALVWPPPSFTSQPAGRNVPNGVGVTFTASASSTTPENYFWLFNGTNLFADGNVSGVTTNTLTIAAATTNNAGNYQLVASNFTGSVTSSIAVLNVGFAPTASVSPASLTVFAGSNAVFTVTPGGTSPFSYQWKRGGTNFGGANITGTNAATLTISSTVTNYSGNYTVVVTNLFGSVTSSVAALTVVLPAAVASSSITNRTVECGQNTNSFTFTATGTAPLSYQWNLNGTPVSGATNASFSLTNLSVSTNIVSVAVTNLYGSATSNATLAVRDTLAPVITLISANRLTNELGSAFTDPGATANDTCAGNLTVAVSGTVVTNAVGTNTLTYTASDGNGNTATTNRIVVVRDTTPPVISGSFTNLTVAANSNCIALLTDVTGTNFILATDLSGSVTITQSPTNNAVLQLGTNTVVLTVADASGNKSYSTNYVIVSDQMPPVMVTQPQSQTNLVGTTASFGVLASACTPQTYQWSFNDSILTGRTNSSLTLSNVSPAAAGNYSVVVTATGGATTSAVVSLTVNLNPTAVALAASANPAGFKDDLNFTAAVTPTNVTGSIQFFTNNAVFDSETLVAGQAVSTNVSSLPRGTNLITAVYSGDVNDLPATNQLLQIVTNHPPVAVPAFFTREAGTPLDIALTDLAAGWNDVDGDPVSLAAIGISANGVTVSNDTVTLFYSSSNNVADQFVCTVSDGFGGTAFQTVNIAVVFPNIISVVLNPAGSITLSLSAAPGYTYVLEATPDLSAFGSWLPVATNTLGTNGVWSFTDTSATNFPQQFYRLRLVQ